MGQFVQCCAENLQLRVTKMKEMVMDLRKRKSTNTEVVYSTEPTLLHQEALVLQHMQLGSLHVLSLQQLWKVPSSAMLCSAIKVKDM